MRVSRVVFEVTKTVKRFFSHSVYHVSGLVYPSFCVFCDGIVEQNEVCCDSCLANVRPPATCELSVTPSKSIKVYSLGDYRGHLRRILMGKFNGDQSASWRLATVIAKVPEFFPFKDECVLNDSILVPIPLHWSRLASRGFNQARVMADVYRKVFSIPLRELIVRSRRTPFQSLLPKKKRGDNVKGAFCLGLKRDQAEKLDLKNKHFILVDDLCTTGETLKAAAKVLLQLNPASISAVVICRVL